MTPANGLTIATSPRKVEAVLRMLGVRRGARAVPVAIVVTLAMISTLSPRGACAAEAPREQPPPVRVLPASEILWPLLQLIPSPEVAFGDGRTTAALRWELTPLLYSFGLREPSSRVRAFFVPPPARFTGSFELVGSVEYAPGPPGVSDWVARLGARVTLPLVDRGEALALSLGTAAFLNDGDVRPSFDVGLLTLFGTCGIRATLSPELAGRQIIVTLVLRFF
ncbi:MAG TPA: hypothetical protein VFQ61_08165 [Polyangiaceae bacterium]|nr:hypothetical protein [Polyangiaceae bacterium]